MSLSWHQRKTRLAALLKSQGDEDADGMALDRLMHGQNVIGKTCMLLRQYVSKEKLPTILFFLL